MQVNTTCGGGGWEGVAGSVIFRIAEATSKENRIRLSLLPLNVSKIGTGFAWIRVPPARVIEIVDIQSSKLSKDLECAVLSTVMCTIKNPWSYSIRVGHSPDFRLPSVAILPLCAESDVSLTISDHYRSPGQRLRFWPSIDPAFRWRTISTLEALQYTH